MRSVDSRLRRDDKIGDRNDTCGNCIWIPAFAGMTKEVAGMTNVATGTTKEVVETTIIDNNHK